MRASRLRLWSRLKAVALPFFTRGPRRRALGLLALLIGLLLSINGLNVVNSYVGRNFMTALEQQHIHHFYWLALVFAGVFVGSTIVEVLATYVQALLALAWRKWLSDCFLDRYLGGRSYHRLSGRHDIDNPDQRISDDVNSFTNTTLAFVVLLVNGLLTLIAFAGVLCSITPWLLLAALVYAVCGSVGTILLGRRLVRLDNDQLRKEADFRFALGRVREHAAAVAEMSGEKTEKARLGSRLGALIDNMREIIRVRRNLGFFTTGYNYMPQIIPVVLVAHLYVWGRVEWGTVTQASMAFAQVLGAFSLIVSQFQNVSSYAAVAGRLGGLWEATEPGAAPEEDKSSAQPHKAPVQPAVEKVPDAHQVAYKGVTLRVPHDGRPLVRDLSLQVPQGKRLLITGPSGAGKTALCLAAAGMWQEGQGQVVCPEELMFVPHRPYVLAGRLRDVLLYGVQPEGITDDHLLETLRAVGLEKLAGEPGGLDADRDWPNLLSEGEQEAIAFARVLVANPRFVFLDGAGALDPAWMERLYAALAQTSITYMSVGEQPALLKYHDMHLELLGDGSWRVRAVA